MSHLITLPIILPLLLATLQLLPLFEKSIERQRVISLVGSLALVIVSVTLLMSASAGNVTLYALGNWEAPFGIQLVGDRLSSLMVLLTSVLLLSANLYASAGDDNQGRYFYPLMMFQAMGINGAFLTGDIFNLFVFFEILLIASYSLLIHGGGKHKTSAAVHYVFLNLVGSAIFLFALGIIYGTLGTLNMADMALRVRELNESEIQLTKIGGMMLLSVFALKAALLPLQFWLPRTYASAPGPVVALFAIMTKVGIYSIIRVQNLIFGDSAGALTDLGQDWIWVLALGTLVMATLGVISAPSVKRLAAHLVILSVGTLLVAVGFGSGSSLSAALYYAVHSTLAGAAFFLIGDIIAEQRERSFDRIVAGRSLAQPMSIGILFFVAALTLIGMPPLSGFIGKFLIMKSIDSSSALVWAWPLLLIGSLAALVAFSRAGSTLFWRSNGKPDSSKASATRKFVAVGILLSAAPLMSLFAGPITQYTDATVEQLQAFEHDPTQIMAKGVQR